MATMVSKNELMTLMGAEALNFTSWLAEGATQEARAFKIMWDAAGKIDLESPFVQMQLIPVLIAQTVITQPTLDAIGLKINSVESF